MIQTRRIRQARLRPQTLQRPKLQPSPGEKEQIKLNLEAEGYEVFTKLFRSMDVGVPQLR
jgi:hypothetical protein